MSRRTKKICLTLAGSSLLLAGCPSPPPPPPPAAKVARDVELHVPEVPPHEAARPLTAILAGNLLGLGGLGPLPTLTAAGAALVPEGPGEDAPAEGEGAAPTTPTRRPIYHATYAHPYYRYGSGFHAPPPIILLPVPLSSRVTGARPGTTSKPGGTSHAGGFGSTGRAVGS